MSSLPDIDLNFVKGKKVLVRADLDIKESEVFRLEVIVPTLRKLFEANCEITLIGHRGKPDGKNNKDLSLEPIGKLLENLLIEKWGEKDVKNLKMHMMENLRFDPGEEVSDEYYARHLSENRDYFVNEAFASSHRKHASIVQIPQILPSAAGIRFQEEVDSLSKLIKSPKKPFIAIISGLKDDKLKYARKFVDIADKVIIAGRLPDMIGDDDPLRKNEKVVITNLLPDKEDITIHSIEEIEGVVKSAGSVFLAGPVGKFEEEGHMLGTKRVFDAVAKADAYKVAGGGDTIVALKLLDLFEKFDWVSVGGGASLEFLTIGTLPGIEALEKSSKQNKS